ncbi:GNAT family N-acetyltransferase [Streptomyces sp. NPDC057695]|uniref:GNAT family N-acetyltransferase n=1 Tax=Streptomyces sp. NPDC057695 TaxID=3346217 RepID=UPI0036ADD98A
MVIHMPLASGLTLRPYTDQDRSTVLNLVNADRLPGQPPVDRTMLAEALAGRSQIDAGWWAELNPPTTTVATDLSGRVLGVLSRAVRPQDHTGLILWMHCGKTPEVARALVHHALTALADCRRWEAYQFASALTLGLEGLPVTHRPAVHAALTSAGFIARDEWRYMRRSLPASGLPRLEVDVEPVLEGWRLTAGEEGRVQAQATVGLSGTTGVLWWIGVEQAARGRGLGRAMLGSALDFMSARGAHEVILYVDDASGDPEQDRTAANVLYESARFVQVDRLFSYQR